MKKIALCLHGYFGSLTDQASTGQHGYEHIKKHILSWQDKGYQVDVFIHSWQPELRDMLSELYSPVHLDCEEQIDFNEVCEKNQISKKFLDPYNKLGNRDLASFGGSGYVGPERILSHFYSIQKVFKAVSDYEEACGWNYDCVIKSRFDLGRINRMTSGPGKQNPWACQCIDFDPTRDMKYFYMAHWDLFNEGPADMWFYSSSENMEHFSGLYNFAIQELQVGSDYHKAVVTGWPESKKDNFRSNECFKEDKATDLHCYPPHMVVNTILLYKWFLIKSGLWEKKQTLVGEWE